MCGGGCGDRKVPTSSNPPAPSNGVNVEDQQTGFPIQILRHGRYRLQD